MQIRAQLAAEGHPLLGDTMYEPLASQAYSSTRASQGAQEMNGQGSQCEEQLHFATVDTTGSMVGGTDVLCNCRTIDNGRTGRDEGVGVAEVLAEEVGPEVHRPVRLLNEPLASGIGLQACCLEVHAPDDLMGPSPAIFEASVPWWREPV